MMKNLHNMKIKCDKYQVKNTKKKEIQKDNKKSNLNSKIEKNFLWRVLTFENFSASKVALDIRSLRSGLKRDISLTSPKRISVCNVRSWASSIIITLEIYMK